MTAILCPNGECKSSPIGVFKYSPMGFLLSGVETIEETRTTRLKMLAKEYGGLANLCEILGASRKETSGLSRILNGNVRHDRDGKPYNMGSAMARRIEESTKKPKGWMDTPPNYFEVHEDAHIANVMRAMESMPESWQREKVARIVTTLLEAPTRSSEQVPVEPTASPQAAEALAKRISELGKKNKTVKSTVKVFRDDKNAA